MADRRHVTRDRRVIERFSDSRVREGMVQIRFWIRAVMGLLVTLVLARLGYSVYLGVSHVTEGVFDATFLAIYASTIFHYDRSISIFLENGSLNSFEVTVDRQRNIWVVFGILTFLYILVALALKL